MKQPKTIKKRKRCYVIGALLLLMYVGSYSALYVQRSTDRYADSNRYLFYVPLGRILLGDGTLCDNGYLRLHKGLAVFYFPINSLHNKVLNGRPAYFAPVTPDPGKNVAALMNVMASSGLRMSE